MTHDLDREIFADFLLESQERLARLEEVLLALSEGAGDAVPQLLDEARLQLHTLKGNSGMMGLAELQAVAHALEDRVDSLDHDAPQVEDLLHGVDRFRELLEEVARLQEPAAAAADRTDAAGAAGAAGAIGGVAAMELGVNTDGVRVSFATLDRLVDLLGEMVIFRNRMSDAVEQQRGAAASGRGWEHVQAAHERLGKTLDALRDGVMRLRMVPLRTLFGHLGRIVHDESLREGKSVRFETRGGETPLDRALLELSSEALGHLVRNCVVHGLETTAERVRAGKPAQGTVRLAAEANTREVVIDVVDDGGGIDRSRVTATARRLGHVLGEGEDPLSLLFLPGFSTRDGADMSSGRGIGLAAVQKAVQRRGGRIEVFSEEGFGTLFRLRLPLSVSITRALLLASDGEEYALPLAAIVESVQIDGLELHEMNGATVLPWRGGLIPLLDLGHSFGTSPVRRHSGFAVIIEAAGSQRALAVERIHGIREVVVKGLDRVAGSPPGISGSTILGDGRAVLILDPAGLMNLSPFAGATAGGKA
ncbi:MAG TPA: chemotaxis protein CheW [Thermoanaerobaculia bacterium]|nr:chemotaxis protein CheW [Thermoanaerobaculia bacterium]